MDDTPVILLMGPTAAGKTGVALALADELPVDVISVDSALVYRGMDIGTAKPDPETLARVPHRLVDICEPEEPYSAGLFVRDAEAAIAESRSAGRIPLLVGGTMMYYRALTRGIAELPEADAQVRGELDAWAAEAGWPALHAELAQVDPAAAARIEPNDSQRIQRALEVYRLAGRSLSALQAETRPQTERRYLRIALLPGSRQALHERIERRLEQMFATGFLDEVRSLRGRPALDRDAPSMRSVGYRQLWAHLDGDYDWDEARARALYATRQLAKRQITWLRAESSLNVVDPLETGAAERVIMQIRAEIGA